MSTLHIMYGYCEDQHKAKLYEHLTHNAPILRVKTIGHIADKAVFAALSYSLTRPNIDDIHWLTHSVPNKKKAVHTHRVERPALSRKKYHQHELSNEQIKQFQKVSRAYRKQHNLTLNEKNWRQHINRKVALSAIESLLVPKKNDATFFLARNQHPTPYSTCN
ncbi:hypothetical protein LCE44_27505 [Vibrio harveyi]|uniref:hypothetical protein n=1 Tax=Vibrio harveyi group TaxID=717610 RepID=UPI00031638D4|nr:MULTISPECIES: hypothetical protein [Vibrio harveyi group]KNY38862.1 hypothetical protein AKG94_25930 [Vibrio harveyi]MCR9831919.1 hypothetical protein [Vibrio parahaemolyticus]MDF5088392.1 hypothetical protein [Vibrio parahaemolyticus]HDM8072327.1 hypothetical protein [Vibrio harveyi]